MATPFIGQTFKFTQPDGSKHRAARLGRPALRRVRDARRLHRDAEPGDRLLGGGAAVARRQYAASPRRARRSARRRGAGVPRGLRIRREAALARGRESALRVAGRRCDQRRQERRQQMRTLRAMAAAGGPLLAPPQRQTVGDFVGLCLLVDFSDVPGTIAARRGRALLQPGRLQRLRQQRLGARLLPRQLDRPLPLHQHRRAVLPGAASEVVLHQRADPAAAARASS